MTAKEKKLSDRMKQEAVALGLCARWTADWREGTTKDEMVRKFVDGLDFCIKHDWPAPEVIKREFGDVIHKHGVYVDEAVRLTNPGQVVLNGSCDATADNEGYSVANIYVRHKSRLKINVSGNAYVHISVYDRGSVEVACGGRGKCFVYRYGGDVSAKGNVKIRERRFSE